MEVDGYLNLVQLGRLDLPVSLEKKLGVYKGYSTNYRENKARYESIPKEKRKIPYICASRVIVIFPRDISKSEILRSLTAISKQIETLWQEENPKEE